MSAARRLLLAGCLALLALAVPAAAHAENDVHPACSPAPADCSGWYRSAVTITWTADPGVTIVAASCPTRTIATDGTTRATCRATFTGGEVTRTRDVSVDTTPPTLLPPVPARAADANGWYRLPVDVAFRGTDATSGILGCTAARYAGLDSAATALAGTCTDKAGNSRTGAFPLRYDATPPVIRRAVPGRKPDHHGWYNHPVVVRFRAKDKLSGLAQCPPVLIGGLPSSRARPYTGACADVAGNVAMRTFAIPYDGAPPVRPVLRAVAGDRRVRLAITASPDTSRIRVTRTPGRGGAHRTRLFTGRVRDFVDAHVANGRRYRYAVTALDRAGNYRRARVRVVPRPGLLAPADGAVASTPPVLRWTRVRGARYYNVQLFRDGVKVLSRWPRAPVLKLAERWRYAGRVQSLAPGRYRWYVWPGLGRRAARQFGALVGARGFTVPAAPGT